MWIMPTTSRPGQCADVIGGILRAECASPGVVFLNGHVLAAGYFKEDFPRLPEGWGIYISHRNLGALGALNRIFEDYPDEPFYGFIADDELLESPRGFDRILVEAAGDWDISHGDDGIHNGNRFQGYCVIGGDLARAVGYLAIQGCWHSYGLDNMWEEIARWGGCIRHFCPGVRIDHRHYMHGKGVEDACYKLAYSRKEADGYAFQSWKDMELPKVLARIDAARKAEAA